MKSSIVCVAPSRLSALTTKYASRSQQKGGALGLAILATLSVEATEDTLTGLGREPQPADQAQALVDGFHVAYLGSALLIAGGFVALLFLLRREDVVAVGEGEAAMGTVAG